MTRPILLSLALASSLGCEEAKWPMCDSNDDCNYQGDEVCRAHQCVKPEAKPTPSTAQQATPP
jgi:hypothetical protein